MNRTTVRYPAINVPTSSIRDVPRHIAMSKVTDAMWHAGVEEVAMEEYCSAIAEADGPELVAITGTWVTLT